MTWLQFISSIVSAVAWPATAVLALVVLRGPLGRLVQGPVTRLKAGPAGLELEWERQAQQVRHEISEVAKEEPPETASQPSSLPALVEELQSLAGVSPSAVVLESYSRVEGQLRALLAAAHVPIDHPVGASALARLAEQRGLITHDTRDAIDGLSVLRNLAAHEQAAVNTPRALDFAAMSDAILYSLRQPGQGTVFTNAGLVGLLDETHAELGTRQPCRFSWTAAPWGWTIQLLTTHKFDLQSMAGAPSYLILIADGAPEERMFMVPLIGRPVHGAYLIVGE